MDENEELEDNNEQALENIVIGKPRSIESKERVYLRFVNLTNRCIELVWLNYRGACERYSLLRVFSQYVDVNTFETHPWIARDQYNKDIMRIERKPIYYPRKVVPQRPNPDEPHIRYAIIPKDRRLVLKITLPIYSLRERCLMELRNHLSTAADVEALHLPGRLCADLRTLIAHKERITSAPMDVLRSIDTN